MTFLTDRSLGPQIFEAIFQISGAWENSSIRANLQILLSDAQEGQTLLYESAHYNISFEKFLRNVKALIPSQGV